MQTQQLLVTPLPQQPLILPPPLLPSLLPQSLTQPPLSLPSHDVEGVEIILTIGKSGVAGYKDGKKEAAEFNCIHGISVNPKDGGACFVADSANHRIRKISREGEVTTFAGSGVAGFANGPSNTAKFSYPTAVDVHHDTGTVYVCDRNNLRIRKITADGYVTTLAGSGSFGSSDGLPESSSFNYPWGIAVNQTDGTLLVADRLNHKIRKITPQGIVSTIAGTGIAGYADGNGSRALFYHPTSVAIHPVTGDIFVADQHNHCIRKISTGGVVTTVAGTGVIGCDDGSGAVATFHYPYYLAINHSDNDNDSDSDSSLLITDYKANKIRKLSLQQGVVSTITRVDGNIFELPTGIAVDRNNRMCYVVNSESHKINSFYLEHPTKHK